MRLRLCRCREKPYNTLHTLTVTGSSCAESDSASGEEDADDEDFQCKVQDEEPEGSTAGEEEQTYSQSMHAHEVMRSSALAGSHTAAQSPGETGRLSLSVQWGGCWLPVHKSNVSGKSCAQSTGSEQHSHTVDDGLFAALSMPPLTCGTACSVALPCALLGLQGITAPPKPDSAHCTLGEADLRIPWSAGLPRPQPVSVSKRRIVTARAGPSLAPAGPELGLPGLAMIDTLDSGDSEQSFMWGAFQAAPRQQVGGSHLSAC